MINTAYRPTTRSHRITNLPSVFASRRQYHGDTLSSDVAVQEVGASVGPDAEGTPVVSSGQRASEEIVRDNIYRLFAATEPSDDFSSYVQPDDKSMQAAIFRQLASIWREETSHLSSLTQACNHWAYRRIIAIGKPAIPLLLKELRDNPNYWFCALRELTGVNPVPPEARGQLKDMASAWLRWASDNGIAY